MEEEIDAERTAIRKELSELSFGELLRLKERLGTKVYDEALFGAKKTARPASFKRVNKNRPREMSSKLPVGRVPSVVPVKKPAVNRDPRFDSLCGAFDDKVFRKAYHFVGAIRSQEQEQLRQELSSEADPQRKAEIKYLLQRMENKQREESRREERERSKQEEHRERMEGLKRGERVHFPNKAERQARELVGQFETLKQNGRLSKDMERHRKKANHRDRKRLQIE